MKRGRLLVFLMCWMAVLAEAGSVHVPVAIRILAPSKVSSPSVLESVATGAAMLAGCPLVVYATNATIGNSLVSLLVDTGSSTLVVASTLCTSGCSNTAHRYDTSTGTATGDGTQQVAYGDGSAASGPIWSDVVAIAQTSVVMPFLAIQTANTILFSNSGCLPVDSYPALSSFDGILGMAYDALAVTGTHSWLDELTSANLPIVDPILTMWLCAPLSMGELTVGSYANLTYLPHPEAVHWTSLDQDTYYVVSINGIDVGTPFGSSARIPTAISTSTADAIVDSGTTQWLVSMNVLYFINGWCNQQDGWTEIFGTSFFLNQVCLARTLSASQRRQLDALAPMLLSFSAGFSLPITIMAGPVFTVPIDPSVPSMLYYCPGIAASASSSDPMIIGYAILNQYVTLFDFANSRVGFMANTDSRCGLNHSILTSDGTARAPPLVLRLLLYLFPFLRLLTLLVVDL